MVVFSFLTWANDNKLKPHFAADMNALQGQGANLKLGYLKVCMSSCVLLQVPLK
jgi:hypothetical protein